MRRVDFVMCKFDHAKRKEKERKREREREREMLITPEIRNMDRTEYTSESGTEYSLSVHHE